MSANKLVLVDVDGVVADFVGAVLDIQYKVPRMSGRCIRREDVKTFDGLFSGFDLIEKKIIFEQIALESFCSGLDVIDKSAAAIFYMREHNIDVHFVTSPWVSSKFWEYERRQWLKAYLGAKDHEITQTMTKHIIDGYMLIDDKTETVVKWNNEQHRLTMEHPRQSPGFAVRWNTPHNQNDAMTGEFDRAIYCTDDWNRVFELLEIPAL